MTSVRVSEDSRSEFMPSALLRGGRASAPLFFLLLFLPWRQQAQGWLFLSTFSQSFFHNVEERNEKTPFCRFAHHR